MAAKLEDVRAYVVEALGERLGDGDTSVTLAEIKIDSLDLYELLMDLDERFGVEIDVDVIDQNLTIENLCRIAAEGSS